MNSKFHAQLLHLLMENDQLQDSSVLRDFVENDVVLKTALIKSKDESVGLVCNLPTLVPKMFAMVTEGDLEKLVRVMAHIEEVDAEKKCIESSHVIRFDEEYLKSKGKVGVLILNAEVSPVLSILPELIKFNGEFVTPYLVILIDSHEYEIWKSKGNDALMDYFEETNKSLVAI
jgi:hypothetical protein